METVWHAAINTPWWVYILFAVLLRFGYQTTKTRVVSVNKLFIIPLIFLAMSIHTIVTSVPFNLLNVGMWTISLILGIGLGWWQISHSAIKVDKKHNLLQLPGNWSTMLLIFTIFATKYYFGYQLAVHPYRVSHLGFDISVVAISGILAGMFIGRLLCCLWRVNNDSQTNLLPT